MNNKIFNYATLALIVFAMGIAGYFYWLHQRHYPSTDDAYIEAHIVSIASQITGKVDHIFVRDQEAVKENQLLFTIDARPFEIAYQKAQANLNNVIQQVQAEQHAVYMAQAELAQRQAEWQNAKKNYLRITALVKKGFYAHASGDDALRAVTVAKEAVIAAQNHLAEAKATLGKTGDQNAQIQMAQALLAQAKLNLQYTQVYSPTDGYLAKFNLQPGQTIAAYEGLFSLVKDHAWWVAANMKETDLMRIRPGQKALIHVDMYPSHVFHGVVKSISSGSGASFSLLPAENASGNWVKVTQRFSVRVMIIDPSEQFPLRVGASCTVTIDTISA